MWTLYLYPIFFISLLIKFRKDRSYVFYALVFLYLLSSLAAIYLVKYDLDYSNLSHPFLIVFFHILMISLILLPAKKLDCYSERNLELSNEKVIMPFTIFIIVVTLISMWYNIRDIDIYEVLLDAAAVRSESVGQGSMVEQNSTMAYILVFASQFNSVPLALMLYNMKYNRDKRFLIFLLLLCSISSPISLLRISSRAALAKFLFVFLAVVFLMRNQISTKWKKTLKIILLVLISTTSFVFAVITVSRFSTGFEGDTLNSVVNYFGMGIAKFATLMKEHPWGALPYHGALRFPLFCSHSISVYNLDLEVSSIVSLNSFSTAIGSWIADCGAAWTIIIALSCFLLINSVGNMKHFTIFTLVYIIMIYEFLFMSIFFFEMMISKYLLSSIILMMFLDRLSRNGKNEANS